MAETDWLPRLPDQIVRPIARPLSSQSLLAGSSVWQVYENIVNYDPAAFAPTPRTVRLEVVAYASGLCWVRVANATTGVAVPGSEMPVTSSTASLLRGSALALVSGDYRVEVGPSVGAQITIESARLVIDH